MEIKYKIDDLKIASFLLTQNGITLLNVIEEHPRHFVFILSNPKKCEKLKQKYLNGAKAIAQSLFQKRDILLTEMKSKSKPY